MKTVSFIFIIISIVVCFGSIGEASLKDGLVLYLTFDQIEGGKVKDMSGNSNDGIVNGDAKLVDGKFGKALEFDGIDDFVEVPLTPSITFGEGDSLTVQAWVKTDDSPTQNDGIVGNYRQSTQALWVFGHSGDDPAHRGKFTFSVRDVGKVHSAGLKSPKPLNDGEWHYAACMRDNKNKVIRMYVDGDLIGEAEDKTENINSGQSIWIGEHLSRYFKGIIDEVKAWNRPLSASEISQSMAGSTPVTSLSETLSATWGFIKKQ